MKTYTYYFKAKFKAKNGLAAEKKADDHIKTKYKDTMKITDFVDQDEF